MVVCYHGAGLVGCVAGDEGLMQFGDGQTARGQSLRVQQYTYRLLRAAYGLYIARPRYALEFRLQGMGDLLQVKGAAVCIVRPQGQGHNGDVVYALGLDQHGTDVQPRRPPVLMGIYGVVQAHQRLGARHPDLELYGQHRHTGPG